MVGLIFLASAVAQPQECYLREDCPSYRDIANALVIVHGTDSDFLLERLAEPPIKDFSRPIVDSSFCQKTGEETARCGVTVLYKIDFANRWCERSGTGEINCVGDHRERRHVVYLADFRRTAGVWTIERSEHVVGLDR